MFLLFRVIQACTNNQSDSEDLTISSPTQSSSKFASQNNTDRPVHFSVKPQMQPDVQLAHPVALRYPHQQHQQYQQQQQHQLAYGNSSSSQVPEPPPRHSRSSSLGAIIPLDPAAATASSDAVDSSLPHSVAASKAGPTVPSNQPWVMREYAISNIAYTFAFSIDTCLIQSIIFIFSTQNYIFGVV